MRYLIVTILTFLITDVYGKRDSLPRNSSFHIGLDYQRKYVYNTASEFNFYYPSAAFTRDYNSWTAVIGYGINLLYTKAKWAVEVDLNRSKTVVIFDVLTRENTSVSPNDYKNNYKNYLTISQNCYNVAIIAKKQLFKVKKSAVTYHFGINLCYRSYFAKIIEKDFYNVDSLGFQTKTGNTWQDGEPVDIKYTLGASPTQELTSQFKFGLEYTYQCNTKFHLFGQFSGLYGSALVESMVIAYNYETATHKAVDLPRVLKVSNTNSGYLFVTGARYQLNKKR